MDVSTYEATGATTAASDIKKRTRVADSGSRIAFSVNEDLGGGMRAGVYCETGVNIDTATGNGQAGTANVNSSEWCSREGRAYVGSGNYEFRLGRQNVFWTQGALNEAGSTFLGSDTLTNMFSGGMGVYGVRLENMMKVAVTGGAFAGSEVYYGLMTGNETTAKNLTPTGKYQGFKLTYTQGQLVGMVDYQSSTDSAKATAAAAIAANASAPAYAGAAGANSFDRTAVKYGVGYKYNPTSIVSVQMWNKERTDVTTAGAAYVSPFNVAVGATTAGDAKDSGYGFTLKHDLGGGLLAHAQYSKANDIKSTTTQANTGATAYTLGVTKALSKRTHVLGSYHVITNQANAAYNMVGGSYNSATSGNGADVKMLAVGMIHNF
jgi:predicted porin